MSYQNYYGYSQPMQNMYQPVQNLYSPVQPQMQQVQTPVQSQPMNSGFTWVQGEAAAKAYPVGAGNTVLLMDSDNPVLYLKSTDQSGRPMPMVVYDLVERKEAPIQVQAEQPKIDLSEYVKRDEIEKIINDKMSSFSFTTTPAIVKGGNTNG